jgi:hypothetical protein
MVLTAKAVLHERVHVAIIELVKAWLESMAAVFEMGGQLSGTGNFLEMQHDLRNALEDQRIRESLGR